MPAASSLEEDIEYLILEPVEYRANNSPTWKFFSGKSRLWPYTTAIREVVGLPETRFMLLKMIQPK